MIAYQFGLSQEDIGGCNNRVPKSPNEVPVRQVTDAQ